MDFYDDEDVVDCVVSAGFNGMYRMTEYLIKNGHSRIAYVGSLMYTESITDRYFWLLQGADGKWDWAAAGLDYQG